MRTDKGLKSQTEAGGYEQLRRFALAAEAGLCRVRTESKQVCLRVGIGAGVTERKNQSAPPRKQPKHQDGPARMGV